MPKPQRGGQRAKPQPQTPVPPPQQRKSTPPQPQPQPQPTPPPQPQPKATGASHDDIDWDGMKFPELTQQEYDAIYSANRGAYTGNVKMAKKMYEADVQIAGGYSYAQTMNHQLNGGLPLDVNSQYMKKYLTQAMHPIGVACTMTRLGHDTLLNQMIQAAGLKGPYTKYTEAQLKAALVGGEFKTKAFGSYSTNEAANPFKNLSSRELVIKARTAPTTKIVNGAKTQRECITGIGQPFRVTDIKVKNSNVYTRAGKSKQVVELYIDLW